MTQRHLARSLNRLVVCRLGVKAVEATQCIGRCGLMSCQCLLGSFASEICSLKNVFGVGDALRNFLSILRRYKRRLIEVLGRFTNVHRLEDRECLEGETGIVETRWSNLG